MPNEWTDQKIRNHKAWTEDLIARMEDKTAMIGTLDHAIRELSIQLSGRLEALEALHAERARADEAEDKSNSIKGYVIATCKCGEKWLAKDSGTPEEINERVSLPCSICEGGSSLESIANAMDKAEESITKNKRLREWLWRMTLRASGTLDLCGVCYSLDVTPRGACKVETPCAEVRGLKERYLAAVEDGTLAMEGGECWYGC